MELLTREQLDLICKFDVPTINNAIEIFNLRKRTEGFTQPGLLQRTGGAGTMAGYAVTAKVAAANPPKPEHEEVILKYYKNLFKYAGRSIAAIQDIDQSPVGSFWGDVQASVHKALGCNGTIVNGGIRDIQEVEKIGFGMYSTHILVSHAYIHMEQCDCPVEICGLTVNPGDLLCVDCHGVVSVPHEVAPLLAEACKKIMEAENPVLEPCKAAIAEGRYIDPEDMRRLRIEMSRKRNSIEV